MGAPELLEIPPDRDERSLDIDQKGSFSSDGDEPTDQEFAELRHIGDKIPISAWLVAVVELAERFTYYGITGPFQNYMQNKRDDPLHPGALGLGQSSATALQYFFQFCKYIYRKSSRRPSYILMRYSYRVLCHSNSRGHRRRCLVGTLQRYRSFRPDLRLRSHYIIHYIPPRVPREWCWTWWPCWRYASSRPWNRWYQE